MQNRKRKTENGKMSFILHFAFCIDDRLQFKNLKFAGTNSIETISPAVFAFASVAGR